MENSAHSRPYLLFTLILSVFALLALAVEMVLPLDDGAREILHYADWLLCVLFFIDFLVSLVQAKNKRSYLLTWGWLDLLSSVPVLPAFRVARLARIARVLRVLRAVRGAKTLASFVLERRLQSGLLAAALVAILLVVTGSIAVYHFEATAGGNIKTAHDALWWAVVTMATVGYGDLYPVTLEGRIVAVFLFTAGVGLFGTLSGSVAAWFLSAGVSRRGEELAAIRAELAEVKGLLERRER